MSAGVRVLAISGSLRTGSSNAALLRAAQRLAPPGMTVELYGRLGDLPHFNPDLDVDPAPEPVRDLRARIAAAHCLLLSSPEYAHGVPGVLKNALDWLVSALETIDKPIALLNASPSSGQHAHAQLVEILTTMNTRIVGEASRPLPFLRARLGDGKELVDPDALAALRTSLEVLAREVLRARGAR
jgi:NAD(P)H-dependent FMN reductase